MDKTDVDSSLYYIIFDYSQSRLRIARVSKGSNKKFFAIKLFQCCDLKTEQRYVLQEEMKISKSELSFLVNKLNEHLARVPVTSNKRRIMQMRDEVFSSVGPQDMDTSVYHVFDREDIEFHWANLDLNKDAVLDPGLETPSSASTFNDFEMSSVAGIPILIDKEQDKANSLSLLPITTVSEDQPAHLC